MRFHRSFGSILAERVNLRACAGIKNRGIGRSENLGEQVKKSNPRPFEDDGFNNISASGLGGGAPAPPPYFDGPIEEPLVVVGKAINCTHRLIYNPQKHWMYVEVERLLPF